MRETSPMLSIPARLSALTPTELLALRHRLLRAATNPINRQGAKQ